ncbi:MAG: aldo/keto reductase [Vicinamibacterales bacterium]
MPSSWDARSSTRPGRRSGHSESLLGALVRAHAGRRLFTATKLPPKNGKWPARPSIRWQTCFRRITSARSPKPASRTLGLDRVDLLQFHVWHDGWADDPTAAGRRRPQGRGAHRRHRHQRHALAALDGRPGPSNRPHRCRSGRLQRLRPGPEDELFPLCRELDVAVIARVPLDEGSLTGTLAVDSRWPEGDFRNAYFADTLHESVKRAEALRPLVPAGETLPSMALGWILSNPDVAVVIPGMRKAAHVEANMAVSDRGPLTPDLLAVLRTHRWNRKA